MAQIVSISNNKGGVGKTTTAVAFAAGIARHGFSVLLVDLDAQQNLTQSLHITDTTSNTYDALHGKRVKPQHVADNIDILPASKDLNAIDIEAAQYAERATLLAEALEPFAQSYDYIVIDTPPTAGLLLNNALTASNGVVIPLQPHFLALQGIATVLDLINRVQNSTNKGLTLAGVLITQYDSRSRLHKDILNVLQGHFGTVCFSKPIRMNIALTEAPQIGTDIFTYAPDSAGAKDYGSAVEELLHRMPAQKRITE